MKYTISRDAVTIIDGGETKTISRDAPNFVAVCAALRRRDWHAASRAMSVAGSIEAWSPRFKVNGEDMLFDEKPVPASFGKRVLAMASSGESPLPLLRFFERLDANPTLNSRAQLYDFLAHAGLPIEAGGTFLAYKGVRRDYMDRHSGTIRNKPGDAPSMARGEINPDPNCACGAGLHVGALSYAKEFAGDGHVVVCRVDPANVVSVPNDHRAMKMRTCRYEVIGHFGDQLPSTTIDEQARADEAKYQAYMLMSPSQLMSLEVAELREFLAVGLRVVGALPSSKADLVGKVGKIVRS